MQDGRRSWTQEELILLKQHYPQDTWQELLVLISKHTRNAICIKAKELKIRKNISAIKRFMTFVKKQTDGCWYWMGSRCRDYGRFKYQGKTVRAHRWIYEHHHGPIQDNLTIDHMCKNPPCVNPKHLRLLDAIENVMIGNAIPAQNARKTYCKRGHKLEHPNLVGNNPRQRRCRICHNKYSRDYRK